jgi:hypothetical protein
MKARLEHPNSPFSESSLALSIVVSSTSGAGRFSADGDCGARATSSLLVGINFHDSGSEKILS